MPTDAAQMERTLTGKLQFVQSSRRHLWYEREFQGYTVTTMMSHGETEIRDKLMGKMARQMNLTLTQLKQAVACTLSGADYSQILAAHFNILPDDIAASSSGESAAAWQEFEAAVRSLIDDVGIDYTLRQARVDAAGAALLRLGHSHAEISQAWADLFRG